MSGCTSVVKSSENSGWSPFLYQITHDLVVEELDWCPFDLFPDVFLLLSLQSELNEDLLELFVNIVDA